MRHPSINHEHSDVTLDAYQEQKPAKRQALT